MKKYLVMAMAMLLALGTLAGTGQEGTAGGFYWGYAGY